MKQLITLCLLIIFQSISLHAQECEPIGEPLDLSNFNRTEEVYEVPVSVKIIRSSDGFTSLNEDAFYEQIQAFNDASQYVNLVVCETFYIDNDDWYYDLSWSDSFDVRYAINPATGEQYQDGTKLNIYLASTVRVSSGSSVCGYAYYPSLNPNNRCTFIANSCADESTTPHELGHCFNNRHTHHNNNELVDGSNCSWAGDTYCDTPADPQLSLGTVNSNCEYTGNEVDANGDPYNPDVTNYMAYGRRSCRVVFSQEQQQEHQASGAWYATQLEPCGTLSVKKHTKIQPDVDYHVYDLTGRYLGKYNVITLKNGIFILRYRDNVIKVLKNDTYK
jgi:hypothetical protein